MKTTQSLATLRTKSAYGGGRVTRILVLIAVAALCLVSATTSRAGQVSQPMNVSLTIGTPAGQVSLVVGSLVMAGPAGGPATGTSTVHVTASASLPYQITLDGGMHSAPATGRNLQSAAASLPYFLYQDPHNSQPWGLGDNILGPAVSGVGTGSDQAYTVYGLTSSYPATLPDGTYTDIVTVAVNF